MQWGFCKHVLSKKIKTDIFNKSAFANRKLIVICLFFSVVYLSLTLDSPLDNHLVPKAQTQKIT